MRSERDLVEGGRMKERKKERNDRRIRLEAGSRRTALLRSSEILLEEN
jgi:hypothetical protein